MADWPVQADYRDALQNPERVLRADVLGIPAGGEIERNKMRVPKARSGMFASVYKLIGPNGGAVALKLFNFASPDRERRYRAVDAYVKGLGPRRPAGLVAFRYEAEGIRISRFGPGALFPVQTMDWVKGDTLGEWFKKAMGRGDAGVVRRMADHWVKLIAGLRAVGIAHGDLQHDNVMVVNDAPVLVDYDGMCVPDLEGADQLECGKPAYQHPARDRQKLSPRLDDFPAWVILIALRAAAADPGLYDRYVIQTNNENLLFTPEDHQDPGQSGLWKDLLASPDPDVREWAAGLRACLGRPFGQIPPFEIDPHRALREAKEWGAVAAEADRLEGAGKKVPDALAGRVEEARRRVACRDRVRKALAAGDVRSAVAAYDPPLLEGWPDAAEVKKHAERARAVVVPLLDELKAAITYPGSGNEQRLIDRWNQHAAELKGVKEAEAYRQRVEQWAARIAAAARSREAGERFRAAAANPAATEKAVATAWQEVVRVGPPPGLTDAEQQRGEAAVRRVPILDRLKAVPAEVSEVTDRQLAAAWNGPALDGCREAQPYRPRVVAAAARLKSVEAVGRAVEAADTGGPEKAVVDAAAGLPPGYDHRYADRVRRAAHAVARHGDLQKVLATTPDSDTRIANAWEALTKSGSNAPATLPPQVRARCRQAVARRSVLTTLKGIDASEPSAERQDQRWVQVWKQNEALLAGCAEAVPHQSRYNLAARRQQAWAGLSAAIAGMDLKTVRLLAADRELAAYPPVVAHRGQIDDLVRKADRIDAILAKLGAAAAPLDPADLAFLRENHALFGRGFLGEVVRVVENRLRARGRLTAGDPPFQSADGAAPLVRVNWGWSDFGVLSSCLVASDPSRHLNDPSEAGEHSAAEIRAEDHSRNRGGTLLPWPPGKLYVTIWPVVDLGWRKVYGPPLHLGPIPGVRSGSAADSGRWG